MDIINVHLPERVKLKCIQSDTEVDFGTKLQEEEKYIHLWVN